MYTTLKSNYKTFKSTDINFVFSPDGITLVPRASLIIDDNCPREYKMILATCINNGWLKTLAHQPVHEHFMEELQGERRF